MRNPVPFGKYLLLERISVGGMAEVFKARSLVDRTFDKILAIKRILPSMAADEEFIAMFIDEARIAGQLSHPNIGQIFELGELGGTHFMAMEFVWGKDVLQILNRFRRVRQKMPLTMAAYIASRVCEGLDYAHRKKDQDHNPLHIVHRDVSPQNVLVSYTGEVKLIDFGIAKARSRSSKTQAGVLKGKFGYMSPEQVRALPIDHRSDIFSIGTILFEMTTGERLFAADSDFATLEKVRLAEVQPPSRVNPRITPELEAIILKALQRDTDDRYQWASEMQEDLATYLIGQKDVFSAKNLASIVSKLFESELRREEKSMREYEARGPDDWEILGRGSAPAPGAAGSLLSLSPLSALGEVSSAEFEEDQATLIGGPTFEEGEERVVSGVDLVELAEEADEGQTGIFNDAEAAPRQPDPREARPPPARSGAAATGPASSGPAGSPPGRSPAADAFPREPTYIFNAESGRIVQAGAPSALLLDPVGRDDETGRDLPDQGSTVVFDAGLGRSLGGGPGSTTGALPSGAPLPQGARPTLVKDVLLGILVAMVVILGLATWRLLSSARGKPRQGATLVIAATPPRTAEVFLDGKSQGKMPAGMPMTLKALAAGEHRIVLRADEVAPVEQSIDLRPGEVRVLSLVLSVRQQAGFLRLYLDPPGARVFLDGAEVSERALQSPLELRSGKNHEVRAYHDGYEEVAFQVALRSGERAERTVSLVRKADGRSGTGARPPRSVPASTRPTTEPGAQRVEAGTGEAAPVSPTGFLVANSIPWARVLVDGRETGRTTPIAPRSKLPLRPGRHKVTFEVDGKQYHYPITILPGKITRLIERLPVATASEPARAPRDGGPR